MRSGTISACSTHSRWMRSACATSGDFATPMPKAVQTLAATLRLAAVWTWSIITWTTQTTRMNQFTPDQAAHACTLGSTLNFPKRPRRGPELGPPTRHQRQPWAAQVCRCRCKLKRPNPPRLSHSPVLDFSVDGVTSSVPLVFNAASTRWIGSTGPLPCTSTSPGLSRPLTYGRRATAR